MRIATPTLAILAAAAGLAATLAVPASAAQASATSAQDCTKPEAIAKLTGFGAYVNNAPVQDVDGFYQVAPGSTLVMSIAGTLAEAVNGGTARIGLMREGQEKPQVAEGKMAEIFSDAAGRPAQFPVAAGPFNWYLRAQVPADQAAGRYAQALDSKNEAGRQVLCFQMAFRVAAPAA